MSHQVIIIKSSARSSLASGNGNDEVQVTYTPPDDMDPTRVGKEVAKRLKWIQGAPHMDAAED